MNYVSTRGNGGKVTAAGAIKQGLATDGGLFVPDSIPTLTAEEMSHLARITDKPEDLSHSQKSLADYIAVIRMEQLKRQGGSDEDLLRAAQAKYKEKKAYGGTGT